MTKRRATVVLAALLLLPGSYYALESQTRPPAWWRAPGFWPLVSGPVKWRLDAPLLKLVGKLPHMSWGDLRKAYFSDFSETPEATGFVRLNRQTEEEPCPTLWETPVGQVWARRHDETVLEFLAMELLVDRVYESFRVKLRPGDVVVDVGGHLGMFTRFALAREAGQVVVFEPEPTNVACLEKTFAEEIEAGSVVLVKAAAWKERDVLRFVPPDAVNTGDGKVVAPDEDTVGSPRHREPEKWIEVPAVTLDDTVDELGLERVDFVKLDIEGAESDALAGARRTLSRFSPRLAVCVYHYPGDRAKVQEVVLAAQPEYRLSLAKNVAYFD